MGCIIAKTLPLRRESDPDLIAADLAVPYPCSNGCRHFPKLRWVLPYQPLNFAECRLYHFVSPIISHHHGRLTPGVPLVTVALTVLSPKAAKMPDLLLGPLDSPFDLEEHPSQLHT